MGQGLAEVLMRKREYWASVGAADKKTAPDTALSEAVDVF